MTRRLLRSATRRSASRPARAPGTTLRLVQNRRWMDTRDLEIGMYVLHLDRPWSDTDFLFQGFRIDTPELLREVQRASATALVETEKLAVASTRGHVAAIPGRAS